jgi:hypothetical protein
MARLTFKNAKTEFEKKDAKLKLDLAIKRRIAAAHRLNTAKERSKK